MVGISTAWEKSPGPNPKSLKSLEKVLLPLGPKSEKVWRRVRKVSQKSKQGFFSP